jgi:gamma-tubulin complex component 2
MFATYTAYLSKSLTTADPDLAKKAGQPYDPARLEKLSGHLSKYEDNFSHHLRILLDALNYYAATETVVLLSLCARLSTASEGAGEAFSGGGAGSGRFGGD